MKTVKYIQDAANIMQHLLDDLLELSRIGRIVNPIEEFSLDDLVADAIAMVAGRINSRGVVVDIASDLPSVKGDRPRLLEVLSNLLDNAVQIHGRSDRSAY